MPQHHSPALRAFVSIAHHGSFTRAARELDVTASALSQMLAQFERQLGVRLLQRTTRRVGLTEAGREFLVRIAPAMTVIDDAVESARQHGERPAGNLRITVAMGTLLAPVLAEFLAAYPQITLEVSVNTALTDLVAQGFDAGIRLGERLEKDMIAIPLGGPMRSAVVGSPAYFARHGKPKHPRELSQHDCIRFRFASGGLYHWEFAHPSGKERGRWFEIEVSGNLIVNDNALATGAARDGAGLTHLPVTAVQADIDAGRLESVLERWLPPYDGLYLYYPCRYQMPPKLRVFVDFLKQRFD
ncbi:MAG: LysR family transcriptional regulator [Xanthomonadales bacterium]|nr:LysR family transcriptional regulator [Xanthomonadales bacterium]ODU94784.1 MAG: LysR family transcriptional regulator [Rhodanobacter sp. SCN 66-43]OJY82771.1 MAG: LysR family transcriptional regulator [Xanthomonadales bacterium 66-474]